MTEISTNPLTTNSPLITPGALAESASTTERDGTQPASTPGTTVNTDVSVSAEAQARLAAERAPAVGGSDPLVAERPTNALQQRIDGLLGESEPSAAGLGENQQQASPSVAQQGENRIANQTGVAEASTETPAVREAQQETRATATDPARPANDTDPTAV